MKYLRSIITKSLLLMPVLLFLINCSPTPGKDYQSFKLVDHLSASHILESPYTDLIQRFQFVEESLSGKWAYIPELSNHDQSTWGASTEYRVLGDPNTENKEETNLLEDGQDVSYLTKAEENEDAWRWIKTDETLDLRDNPDFDRKSQGIILKRGSTFQFEKILPDGEILLELYIVNKNWQQYQPKLIVCFNGEDVEDIFISRKKWFRIRHTTRLGFYRIEIKFPEHSSTSEDALVVIGRIRLESSSDIALFSTASSANRQTPGGKIQFQYHRNDVLSKEYDQSKIHEYLYLYNIQKQYPLYDFSVRSNPLNIKKKLHVGEYSLNALIAPPRSEYAIPVRILPNASLEFGYGYLHDPLSTFPDKFLKLQVLLESSGKEEVLFEKELSLEMLKEVKQEKIDLSPFAGRKAKLSFITEYMSSDYPHEVIGMPFWANPTIHSSRKPDKANVILISLDTLRPDFLGCYGHSNDTSPAIDETARNSAVFLNAYSTTSWTLPAHVSMLTSLDCLHHQVYYPLEKFAIDTITLADILGQNGYTTVAFTGGAYLSSTYGFAKGFDTYQEIKLYGNKAIRFDEAERLAELSCDWINANHDRGFFLFLHTYQPHDPYANFSPQGKMFLSEDAKWDQIRMETLFGEGERYETSFSDEEKKNIIGLYEGEIRYTDEVLIKPIISALKDLNIYDSTILIITSDHGEEFYEHEAWLHDHNLYEEGIKIPLIIKFPNSEYEGDKIKSIIRITDIMPTILEQLDINTNQFQFDGRSLFPILRGKEKTNRTFLSDLALRQFQLPPTIITTNSNNLKLIINKEVVSSFIKRKSLEFNDLRIELYDLENDPMETTNLASQAKYRSLCFQLTREILNKYEDARIERGEKDKVVMDSSLEERLKALGYIR